MSTPRSREGLYEELESIVGSNGVIAPESQSRYFDDPRGKIFGYADAVLRPSSVHEIADIVKLCSQRKIGIIPFGGGTGGSAGHLYDGEETVITISLERLNKIRSVNPQDNIIVAESGVILADIHRAAASIDRRFGLSLASEGSCTIGGNLASNAGGIQVLRYGNTRDLCLGIEAVMPDGSVFSELQPLRKNNTGYDLRHLMIGSEGTLGIITAATLQLAPIPAETITAMFAVASPADALGLLHDIRDRIGNMVTGFELMSKLGVSLALKHTPSTRKPFSEDHEWYAIAQIEGPRDTRRILETVLSDVFEAGMIKDAILAESLAQSHALWVLRESAYENNRMEGAVVSSDTSVPLSQIGNFIGDCIEGIGAIDPTLRVNCYGHIGDGNIHVNVFPGKDIDRSGFENRNQHLIADVRRLINDITVALDGSISAEHGIGRARTDEFFRYADPVKISVLRQIKAAIDPNSIMNPGALFPPGSV